MLSEFRKVNRLFRKKRPIEDSCTHCEAFVQGGLLEVAIPAFRCRHDAEGSCIMCNYGSGVPIRSRKALESQFDAIVSAMGDKLEILILCTNGSFFDDKNVSPDVQRSLLARAQDSSASMIIIETHLDTLLPDKLQLVRDYIPSKTVILEIGLESSDPFTQKYCYLKEISLDKLTTVMKNAQKMGLMFQLNVILGAPFLSAADQMKDAERTIRWGLAHDSLIALFPMNIKPYTLLYYAYLHGIYRPISHWAMPLLLNSFSSEELGKIDLAWYGNRQSQYEEPEMCTIFPQDCPSCHQMLQNFYKAYVLTEDGIERQALVKQVLFNGMEQCTCMEQEKDSWRLDSVSRKEHVFRLHRALLNALRSDHLV